jgi:hypothetical protein
MIQDPRMSGFQDPSEMLRNDKELKVWEKRRCHLNLMDRKR